jgi:hypothetical protein
MRKLAAFVLVIVAPVAGLAVFIGVREAMCAREQLDRAPQIDRVITLATKATRSELERQFLIQVADSPTYKEFARGNPPGGLIGNAGSGVSTSRVGYFGRNSTEWTVKWATPYPDCDYSKLPVTGGFTRVQVDVGWYRDWHFIPRRPRLEIVDYCYPVNQFFIQRLGAELDALGIPYRVRVVARGK